MKRNQSVKTISLAPHIMEAGMQRAKAFGLKFSHYVGMLIERDVDSGSSTMMIKAKPENEGGNATLSSVLLAVAFCGLGGVL